MIEFIPWSKIARLYRDIVISEKIDGTNSAVGIALASVDDTTRLGDAALVDGEYLVYAQSRSRIITPKADNHGFAAWVHDNAGALVEALGPGLHFGEWWGSGVNRGYGLQKGEKRFSLFNTKRWSKESFAIDHQCGYIPPGLDVVPILYSGEFSTVAVRSTLEQLRIGGSVAAPGFMRPEGVVVYHTAANMMFKVTIEDDEVPKAVAERKPPMRTRALALVA